MMKRFWARLQVAMSQRAQARLPPVGLVVTGVVLCTMAYTLLAILIVPDGQAREFNFQNERGAITALSAIFLAMASAWSGAALTVTVKAGDKSKWVWMLMAVGFGFLALDELLQFHERIGNMIGRSAQSGPFRNWNDAIVIGYGLGALPVATLCLPSLLRYRMVPELFAVAFVFYGLHTLIDSTQEPPTTISIIWEESAKLFCGAFLGLGAFVGFLGALWSSGEGNGFRNH